MNGCAGPSAFASQIIVHASLFCSKEGPESLSSLCNVLLGLEMSSDLKTQQRGLNVMAAKETEVGSGQKGIIIFLPSGLDRKLSGNHVAFIAQRGILPKPTQRNHTKNKNKAAHDVTLEDTVFPNRIVGKGMHLKLDGSRLIKVHLDKASQNNAKIRVETISGIYKKLTGKDINFEFPEFQLSTKMTEVSFTVGKKKKVNHLLNEVDNEELGLASSFKR
uniref:40S ribosomal protein S7 n=1 Tax=Urocitellus parryii TaxID=9999 RepID=A0A8D2KLU4_UROPR